MSRAAFLLLVLGLTGAGACDPGPGGRPVVLEDTVPAGIVGSLDTPDYAYDVALLGGDAYVTMFEYPGLRAGSLRRIDHRVEIEISSGQHAT